MLDSKVLRKKKDPSVLIVGGGAAGIAAASRLMGNGFKNVIILEAENRLGGRVHSVPLGDSVVDLGAHWVHGEEGNIIFELAKPKNLIDNSGDFDNVHFMVSNNTEIEPEIGMTIFEESANFLEDTDSLRSHKGSIQDYMIERCTDFARASLSGKVLKAYMDWLLKFECTIEGCDELTDASASGVTHYKKCPGDALLHWKGKGYGQIIDILLESMKTREKLNDYILMNTEVQQIDWSGLGVIVKCKGGKVYFADHVIVTVSLGVLKEKSKTMFQPPLPKYKCTAIAGLAIGTVDKVYIQFPYKWWPETCSGFSLLWLDEDKVLEKGQFSWESEIMGFYTESGTPTTLTAWLVGSAAREMESCSEEQVKDGCMRTLKKFLSFKYTIPEPRAIVRSSWYSNPHFRGCYSFRSLNSDVLNVSAADLARPLKNDLGKEVVLFAGEATHSGFYSTVHGAIETGLREADNIIEMYKSDKRKQDLKCSL